MTTTYVHGYSGPETRRLSDQADTLAALLHGGIRYPAGSSVLEVGCGVGGQTVHLLTHSPDARLVSVDVSAESLALAKARVDTLVPDAEVEWHHADLFSLPFPDESFDHLFVCFVLEHLPEPEKALAHLMRLLRPGGTITVIEGDHGSAIYHPQSAYAQAAVDCLVRLQAEAGGDALIGRRLFPLLDAAGYADVAVRPCTVYADPSRPELVEGFTRNTFTAMVEGVGEAAVSRGLIPAEDWARGLADLCRTENGTFHYVFFKATAKRRAKE